MLWNGTRSEQQNEMQVRHRDLALEVEVMGRGIAGPVWSSRVWSPSICVGLSHKSISQGFCALMVILASQIIFLSQWINKTELVRIYHYYYDKSNYASHSNADEYEQALHSVFQCQGSLTAPVRKCPWPTCGQTTLCDEASYFPSSFESGGDRVWEAGWWPHLSSATAFHLL